MHACSIRLVCVPVLSQLYFWSLPHSVRTATKRQYQDAKHSATQDVIHQSLLHDHLLLDHVLSRLVIRLLHAPSCCLLYDPQRLGFPLVSQLVQPDLQVDWRLEHFTWFALCVD